MDASEDPTVTNADMYKLVFENDRVRVLEYRDEPGAKTTPHRHPGSVMVTLSSFRRRLRVDDRVAEVELPAGAARWLSAQEHSGENIGDTETHVIFVELKGNAGTDAAAPGARAGREPLGPSS